MDALDIERQYMRVPPDDAQQLHLHKQVRRLCCWGTWHSVAVVRSSKNLCSDKWWNNTTSVIERETPLIPHKDDAALL